MNMKLYVYVALAVIGIMALFGVYRMGGAACREASATAAREHLEMQNNLLSQIEDAKQAREVIYRDKTRIVERTTDNCTDVPIPDAIRMQLSNSGSTKPTVNP
jgi:type II secretory pathway pseudopilin PulG